ncbi:holo-ACP synthase [Candidatus Puniceispirillum sp.]|nr:holo-ACP synthase [Candidatus Puniceispirillum sp.]
MILGIGTDIVDSRRIEAAIARHPNKFSKRIYSLAELSAAKKVASPVKFLAKRFAVKEALYKALSPSGVKGCSWLDAETLTMRSGAPCVHLTGRCKMALEAMTPDGYNANLSVSLSDETHFALAFIIISAVEADWIKTNE